MFSLLLAGFLIGMRHALEADHVAAVASLASRNATFKSTLRHGVIWGLGHSIALFVFGSIVILSDSIIPDQLALGLEFAVGLMLVLLGIDVIRRMLRDRVHFHTHQHGNKLQHFHAHKHLIKTHHNPAMHVHSHTKTFPLRTLFVGLMHGMAGSAALILLTLQSVTSVWLGVLYIALFAIGSVFGMAVLSAVIAVPLMHSPKGLTWLHNGFQGMIGLATVALGIGLMYQIGGHFV